MKMTMIHDDDGNNNSNNTEFRRHRCHEDSSHIDGNNSNHDNNATDAAAIDALTRLLLTLRVQYSLYRRLHPSLLPAATGVLVIVAEEGDEAVISSSVSHPHWRGGGSSRRSRQFRDSPSIETIDAVCCANSRGSAVCAMCARVT
jgi:hypothetical protein